MPTPGVLVPGPGPMARWAKEAVSMHLQQVTGLRSFPLFQISYLVFYRGIYLYMGWGICEAEYGALERGRVYRKGALSLYCGVPGSRRNSKKQKGPGGRPRRQAMLFKGCFYAAKM